MDGFLPTTDYAENLDQNDPLSGFKLSFFIPDPDLIYLDGNSLGRLPLSAISMAQALIQKEWGERLIRSWNESWIDLTKKLAGKIAPLVGASESEIIFCDSTSVNLYKLIIAALMRNPKRKRILTDAFNFPSDLYIIQGIINTLGCEHQLQIIQSEDGVHLDPERLIDQIDSDTAIVVLSHVAYKSGFKHNAEWITDAAHRKGALVLWDLSHSTGAVDVNLNKWNADLAVGCSYKYLNSGPGAPAYLFVRQDLIDELQNPVSGWFGDRHPFSFEMNYEPAAGINRFLVGTPPILSLSMIEPGLDLIIDAGIDRIITKASHLSQYFIYLFDQRLCNLGFSLGSPRDPDQRGAHISLRHKDGYAICQALIKEYNVIPDFRAPDHIRLGFSPLLLSYQEIYSAVDRICSVIENSSYQKYRGKNEKVT